MASFAPGDWVVYRMQKVSNSPGPRASNTVASFKGESYTYIVEKFWVVEEVDADGSLKLRTRRGKTHHVEASDPRLRKPNWWQKFAYKSRFKAVEEFLKSLE